MILLDTNIVLRSNQTNATEYAEVVGKISSWILQGEKLIIASQTLYEFYVVATRPIAQNGFGLEAIEAQEAMEKLTKAYILLPDNEKILPYWLHLIKKYEVKGKKSHDTRLVAFMLSHQISNLYTLNTQDFTRFQDVTLV
jgi:predicted nucleic acid-binding protein